MSPLPMPPHANSVLTTSHRHRRREKQRARTSWRLAHLRHAALSLWLASGAPPAEIAAHAGHSVHVLLSTYAHGRPGYSQIATRHIDQALHASTGPPLAHKSGLHPARNLSVMRPCHSWTRWDTAGPNTTRKIQGETRD